MRTRLSLTLKSALFSQRPMFAMMPSYVASNFVDNLLFVLALLDHLRIEHIAHYGTLLGAVHLGGVAPWDEDADIFVFAPDFESVRERIEPALAVHGFEVVYTARRDALLVRQVPWIAGQGHVGLSLWPGSLDDADDPTDMEWDAFMRHSEAYPMRRYPFHGSYVVGPAKPNPVLERLYGGAASSAAMDRFRSPSTSSTQHAFWSRTRPLEGEADWDAISAYVRKRASGIPWHAATFPWWWFNGAYNVGVRVVRKLGDTIERL